MHRSLGPYSAPSTQSPRSSAPQQSRVVHRAGKGANCKNNGVHKASESRILARFGSPSARKASGRGASHCATLAKPCSSRLAWGFTVGLRGLNPWLREAAESA